MISSYLKFASVLLETFLDLVRLNSSLNSIFFKSSLISLSLLISTEMLNSIFSVALVTYSCQQKNSLNHISTDSQVLLTKVSLLPSSLLHPIMQKHKIMLNNLKKRLLKHILVLFMVSMIKNKIQLLSQISHNSFNLSV